MSVDLTQVAGWFDRTSRGELVTVAERNAVAVWAGVACDFLADPVHALSADGVVRLPTMTYAGTDRELAQKRAQVPVVGAVPVPTHWRTGASAPADLPAWVRASDAERRTLYGAARHFLELLTRTGTTNPQEGRSAEGGWLQVAAIVAVAVAGSVWLGTKALEAGRDVLETRVREDAATARYGALLRAKLEAAKTRYEEGRRTGVTPPPTSLENDAMATPYNATTGRTVGQAGADWWKSGTAWAVIGGTALVAALAGALGWAWTRTAAHTDDTPDATASALSSGAIEDEGDTTWTE